MHEHQLTGVEQHLGPYPPSRSHDQSSMRPLFGPVLFVLLSHLRVCLLPSQTPWHLDQQWHLCPIFWTEQLQSRLRSPHPLSPFLSDSFDPSFRSTVYRDLYPSLPKGLKSHPRSSDVFPARRSLSPRPSDSSRGQYSALRFHLSTLPLAPSRFVDLFWHLPWPWLNPSDCEQHHRPPHRNCFVLQLFCPSCTVPPHFCLVFSCW